MEGGRGREGEGGRARERERQRVLGSSLSLPLSLSLSLPLPLPLSLPPSRLLVRACAGRADGTTREGNPREEERGGREFSLTLSLSLSPSLALLPACLPPSYIYTQPSSSRAGSRAGSAGPARVGGRYALRRTRSMCEGRDGDGGRWISPFAARADGDGGMRSDVTDGRDQT